MLSWSDLTVGKRIIVGCTDSKDLREWEWTAPGTVGTVVSNYQVGFGRVLVLLDDLTLTGSFGWNDSAFARSIIDQKYIVDKKPHQIQFAWVHDPTTVKLHDATYLSSEIISGPVTCRCGFMNEGVSASAFVQGEYKCYQCRVIDPRHRE